MHFLARATLLAWLLTGLTMAVGPARADSDEQKVDLSIGAVAPLVKAIDDEEHPWTSADRLGKNYVVVYFYPGDFTPGCTRQAQEFRDGMNKLASRGVEVVGISGDAVKTHQMFKKAQKLNFTLLADEDGSLARKFGVPVGKGGDVKAKDADGKPIAFKRNVTAARWTFIIDKDGKVVYKKSNVSPALDSKQVTEFIEKQAKK